MGLTDLTLQAVKDKAMLIGSLHKLEQVSVMLLKGMAMYAYIVMYSNNTGETVCCLVHVHLKDILGHVQIEWHVQEMVGTECHQVERFLIKVDAPETILSIQLTEAGIMTEPVRDLVKCRGFIMLSHNGHVMVLWVKAYA